ncbi:MAG: 2-oxoacid:acceptor oxidoreductase subunit alpha [Candidatus Lernaella stagnicola]|nr:2-oxoacid:acceptor oxidoreductase subunit alpha [Candidatus Lernaella stagnicola]
MANLNVVIAGAAGQGVQSAAAIFGRLCLRQGLHLFTTQDYQSRVRGGHNFMRIRISDEPLGASVRLIDYLVALNEESIRIHLYDLRPEAITLCMEQDAEGFNDPRLRPLPNDAGPAKADNPRFVGVKLLAMLIEMIGFDRRNLTDAVDIQLGKRIKPEVLQLNFDAAQACADLVSDEDRHELPFALHPETQRMFVDGHEALALGMVAGGIGVYAGYPMSPSTSLMTALASFSREMGVVVEQVEDEVAAINVACGAAFAGARAAVGTSGAGISLMSETIGLAGISETPVVILDAQRPGPSTGMATRTEQADLMQVVFASQGEFPRAVIAPADHEDAFYMGAEAFNIAERWQIPVFIMTDQAFADSQSTVEEFDPSRVTIDRGPVAEEPAAPGTLMPRYAVTDSGVSPRAYPVLSEWIIQQDSHEHTEIGHLSDNIDNRITQFQKRMRKHDGIAAEFPGPEIVGDPEEALFLCWGSTCGPLLEAAALMRKEGHRLGVAVFRHLYPMNRKAVRRALAPAERLYTVEMNFTGQLGKLLLLECGIATTAHIGKIDGRLFTVKEILFRLREVI